MQLHSAAASVLVFWPIRSSKNAQLATRLRRVVVSQHLANKGPFVLMLPVLHRPARITLLAKHWT